jgi:methionyl-tRNA formyltransferase
MRIIYLGSPQDSVYPLEYLIENEKSHRHEILAVVTNPPKASGRGQHHEVEPPLALFAKKAGILTLQPPKASDAEFQDTLRKLEPDLMITCAYGQILNQSFLDIPKRATINIHPSLLPNYRGATPVQTALLDGLKETGITILFTVKELDAGNIISQKTEPIFENECSGDLMTRLFKLSAPLLIEAIAKVEDPYFKGKEQDPSQVSLCKKIKKEDGLINWDSEKSSIINKYRAFNPWPSSYTFLHQKRIILSKLEAIESLSFHNEEPGSLVFKKDKQALVIACRDGFLKLSSLKPEGSRVLSGTEFWNGLKNRDHLKFS